ncbi:MAG: WD40 repeat domain-containing protein [Candidatus Daviesbacteria bacterium]|nr:WD40 repeat domain-containing protein [Candidatus Daviesbacteria bacterium]
MKIIKLLILAVIIGLIFFIISHFFGFSKVVSAESKPPPGPGQMIPKLSKTANDPILENGGVYPMWGPPCQRYTYYTTYRDKEGRPPEYVKMYFNGDWIVPQKENPNDNDFKKGVRYIYKFVPNKISGNFFFFEASNGLGKTREGIIDSPGNGPVLFEGDFLHNEIAVMDSFGKKILEYPVGDEWVGGIAISSDGKYLAVKTSRKVLLFDTSKPDKPAWIYEQGVGGMVGGDVKGGVAISGDGSKIFASISSNVLLFDKSSNKPVWQYSTDNAYNVAISENGQYVGAATAGSETILNSNLLIIWKVSSSKPLWQYHASGNFHDIAFSKDGSFVVGSTGCPDRQAYIFSKDSNKPVMISGRLTYDSPVQRARITKDGSFASFSTDGGPDSAMVVAFAKNSSKPLWKFTSSTSKAARAMGMTSDGNSIVAANTMGDVYLLNKDGKSISDWHLNTTIGSADISDDGSVIALGSTDNKVHILDPNPPAGGKKDIPVEFKEFVEEVAVSANGKYIAAGTGGSPYFFEEILSPNRNKVYECKTVIEPKPMEEALKSMGSGGNVGDNQSLEGKQIGLVQKILNFFLQLLGQKPNQETSSPTKVQPTGQGKQGTGKCGDTICEPSSGETKENCPKDCSGGN